MHLKNAIDIEQLKMIQKIHHLYIETRLKSWQFEIISNDERDEKHSNFSMSYNNNDSIDTNNNNNV